MQRRGFITLLGGAAAAWPLSVKAQETARTAVVGFLTLRSSVDSPVLVTALRQGLRETGYVEGQNLTIEYDWAEGHYDRLPLSAADLVARKGAVIVTGGGNAPALAAKGATSTIRPVLTPSRHISLQLCPAREQPDGRQHPRCRSKPQAV